MVNEVDLIMLWGMFGRQIAHDGRDRFKSAGNDYSAQSFETQTARHFRRVFVQWDICLMK